MSKLEDAERKLAEAQKAVGLAAQAELKDLEAEKAALDKKIAELRGKLKTKTPTSKTGRRVRVKTSVRELIQKNGPMTRKQVIVNLNAQEDLRHQRSLSSALRTLKKDRVFDHKDGVYSMRVSK